MSDIFARIGSSAKDTEFEVKISMCDICHKNTLDLLLPENFESLDVSGTYIQEITEKHVTNEQ